MRTTASTGHRRAGVTLDDNQLGMGFEQANGVDCEAAGQRTANAVSKYGFNDLGGSTRIVVVQHAANTTP